MSYEPMTPAIKSPTLLRSASGDVVPLALHDAGRPAARPVFELDRESLVSRGLWGFAPLDPRARPFIRLRAQLLSRMTRTKFGITIAVISPDRSVGKSFVAVNLAAVLGELHNICLIDLDFRNPSIDTLIGTPACVGTDALLANKYRLAEIGCAAPDARLIVMPARQSTDATRLLASSTLPAMFEALRRAPETISIIDTPPMLDMDDAMLISRNADGVLLVAEEGHTTARDVREVLRLIGPTPLVGTVLNRSLAGAST